MAKPELAEITNTALPPASLDALRELRNKACETAEFTPQSHQRFLRRVLSPDSPLRNLFMIHGTGTGKTCTAIQIAEEYILRPEFQDKPVLVVSSASVEENFRTQLFDMSRVYLDQATGILSSKQCTGRRYLDMLLRIESEPKNWNNPAIRDKLESTANKIVDEFYEFTGYVSFGNLINEKLTGTKKDLEENTPWVHEHFDNRLIIIDEAHNIREDSEGTKISTKGLENLVKIADGLVLVFLTATPMFDTYEEILFYFNLFLWNDRRQAADKSLQISDFFNEDATLKPGEPEERFRKLCQDYVSFVKGENPFTFPFRLPPPQIADRLATKTSFLGKNIGDEERIKYLSLVETPVRGFQKTVLASGEREDSEEKRKAQLQPTVAVLPGEKSFAQSFTLVGKQYEYIGKPFLTEEELGNYAGKFATVIRSIENSTGVVFVYSNFVEMGARLFAMALEEHGYAPARGETLLTKPSKSGKGKYILLTSENKNEIPKLLAMVKDRSNRDGSQVRVVISSPIVSEGVDFRYIRQIHILEPWWNASRIEQVIGRGLRTCSHQLLDFADQNCTVYLHVLRGDDGREIFDEYTYRTKVEAKAVKIARVRKVLAESAMDCPLQNVINTLPEDWKNLEVPQTRAEGREPVTYALKSMMAPAFTDTPDVTECRVKEPVPDPEHVRPLSTYLDVRDDILAKLGKLFVTKPIWDREELLNAIPEYQKDVVIFNLQNAISTAFRFKDNVGREAILESKGQLYALAPVGVPNQTLVERTTKPAQQGEIELERKKEEESVLVPVVVDMKARREAYVFPADASTRFSEEVLNGFLFDHVLTPAEKRAYLKTRPKDVPFASRLFLPESDTVVLGDTTTDPPELVGEERTKYNEWAKRLVGWFVEKRAMMYGSINSAGDFTVSKLVTEGETVKRNTQKQTRYEPLVCGNGANGRNTMIAFAKAIDKNGVGVPEELGNMPDRCKYIELLAREEHNCFWITPEELDVLFKNKENRDAIAAAFKK